MIDDDPRQPADKAVTTGQDPRRIRIPSRLFHGRVRTSTLTMCIVWLALWATYLFFNQVDDSIPAPAEAVIISQTPYVPYVPPAPAAEQSYPTTTAEVAPPATPTTSSTVPTTPTTPADTPAPATRTQPPTATTTDANPFRLPLIPGLPGFEGESGTEPTGEPGQ